MVPIHHFVRNFYLVILPNKYDIDRAKQEGVPEYQEYRIGAIEAFECENARSDFVAITEKNEKQYIRLHTVKYLRGPRGIFPCIDSFNVIYIQMILI